MLVLIIHWNQFGLIPQIKYQHNNTIDQNKTQLNIVHILYILSDAQYIGTLRDVLLPHCPWESDFESANCNHSLVIEILNMQLSITRARRRPR